MPTWIGVCAYSGLIVAELAVLVIFLEETEELDDIGVLDQGRQFSKRVNEILKLKIILPLA